MNNVGVDAVDLSVHNGLYDEHKDNFMLVMLITDVFAAMMCHMTLQDALVMQSTNVADGHVCHCFLNIG